MHITMAHHQQCWTLAPAVVFQIPEPQLWRAAMLVVERMVQHLDLRIIESKAEFCPNLEIAGKQRRSLGQALKLFLDCRRQFVPAGKIAVVELLRGGLRSQCGHGEHQVITQHHDQPRPRHYPGSDTPDARPLLQ